MIFQYFSRCYVDFNEYAALFGCYPKIDSSHGFPSALNYEAYRDFQENSLNTDVINLYLGNGYSDIKLWKYSTYLTLLTSDIKENSKLLMLHSCITYL